MRIDLARGEAPCRDYRFDRFREAAAFNQKLLRPASDELSAPLHASRLPAPGEVRKAEWSEIDFEKALWTILADRMKQRQPHRVPLSQQSLAILREAAEWSGGGRYIFPELGSRLKPMCENAVNGALRRMGYGSDDITAHGKWSADAIERALSHADGNQVRAAYHRGAHWPERVEMAQWWSDHLDALRKGAQVLAFSRLLEEELVG